MTPPLRRVLLVEDDVSIQAVARMSLEIVGRLQVLVCGSGGAAVAQAPGFAPDLALLDVMMPGMDGPATLAALRALPALARVPVVFLTATVGSLETKRLVELGAIDVIAKPFDPRTLPGTLQRIWEQHHG